MRVKVIDTKGKYITFETLFPIQNVANPDLNEVQIQAEEWVVSEYSRELLNHILPQK